MFLILIAIILAIVFWATRFGMKAASAAVRIAAYVGIFVSIAALAFLLVAYLSGN